MKRCSAPERNTRISCEERLEILSESSEERLAQLLDASSRHEAEMEVLAQSHDAKLGEREATIQALNKELEALRTNFAEESERARKKVVGAKVLRELVQHRNSVLDQELLNAKTILKVFDEQDAKKKTEQSEDATVDAIVAEAVQQAVARTKREAEAAADEEWSKMAEEMKALVENNKRVAAKRQEAAVAAALKRLLLHTLSSRWRSARLWRRARLRLRHESKRVRMQKSVLWLPSSRPK